MTASIPPGPIWAAELLTMTMALILVLLFLLLIPIIVWRFLSRRREGQDKAARALVVASVFLLTAAWCYFLSPTIPWDVRGAGSPLQIEGLASAEQVFFVKEEQGRIFYGYEIKEYLRPAAVLAPWLVLVSLPVLAYGIWTAIRRPPHA